MCQLAYASNIEKLNLKQKQALFSAIQSAMTKTNKSGYGLASKKEDGTVELGRTLDVSSPCHLKSSDVPIFCEPEHEGSIDLKNAKEVIFHARTSTNSVSIQNTHPFHIGSTILCHNGVLSYTGENYLKKTDNDTEDLTYHFNKYGLKRLSDNFSGYAAFIAFKDGLTHIVRDSQASLYYGYSEELDCHFFATYTETLKTIQKALKIKFKCYKVLDDQHIIIDLNKIVEVSPWSGLQYSSYASSLSHLSLGRDISKPSIFKDDHDLKYYDSILDDMESGDTEIRLNGLKISYSEYLKLDNISREAVEFIDKKTS